MISTAVNDTSTAPLAEIGVRATSASRNMLGGSSRARKLVFIGDVLLVVASLESAAWIRLQEPFVVAHLWQSFVTTLSCVTMLYVLDCYKLGSGGHQTQKARVAAGLLAAGCVMSAVFFIVPSWRIGRVLVAIHTVIAWCALVGWRRSAGLWMGRPAAKENILVLGSGARAAALEVMLADPLSPFRIVGFLRTDHSLSVSPDGPHAVIGSISEILRIAGETNSRRAVVALGHAIPPELMQPIINARFQGIEIVNDVTACEKMSGRIPVDFIGNEWLAFVDGFDLISSAATQRLKRMSDVLASVVLAGVFAPLMVGVALAVYLDSGGPVLFRQRRVGRNSQVFTLFKFRSMRTDAERFGAQWATLNDQRNTRFGRWMRINRLDELPQLWNVMRGEMSLVGPRPERPEFVKDLEVGIPYYALRHSVRPGLTGWAQVNCSYASTVVAAQEKLEYDLYYIKNMSIWFDVKIILRTISVVLFGEGAR